LEVGRGSAAGGVDTDGGHVITIADLEDTLLCVVGCVVCAPETVIDVLAESLLILASGVTDFHAEAVTTHEVCPINDLLVRVIVTPVAGERVGVHETAKRVTAQISTVGIQLASVVISRDVYLSLVNETGDLDVVGGLDELYTLKSTGGDETSTVSRLCTPGNFLTFGVTNGGVGLWGCPEAKVVYVVHERSLTHGALILSCRVANIVTDLGTANSSSVIVDLVRDTGRVSIVLVNERSGVSRVRLSVNKGNRCNGEECR
jgi:hypothetical protein